MRWHRLATPARAPHETFAGKASFCVLDAFTGCGGNAIAFARMPGCAAVYACDMDRHRLECVRCASQASSHCPFACLSLRACPRQFAPPLPSLRHVHASMPLPSPPTRGPEGPAACQTQRRGVRRGAQDPLHAGRFLPAGAPPSPSSPLASLTLGLQQRGAHS